MPQYKTPVHVAENERFLPAFSSPHLSGSALNNHIEHGRGGDVGTVVTTVTPRLNLLFRSSNQTAR